MRPRTAAVILVSAVGLSASATMARDSARAQAPALAGRVILSAGAGGSFLVHGTYPAVPSTCVSPVEAVLHERYGGVLEVGLDSEGRLFLIGEIPVEEYVEGIAEVPQSWPMEALKAQAVAARSYALAHVGVPDPTGEALGYDLCATDACQVYRGQAVANGPDGERWRKAVQATNGKVLVSGGRPAETVYFSTSNGGTFGNEDVFGSAPLPYLRPVEEEDDGASPLSHWRAEVSIDDAARFLRAAGHWPEGRAMTGARRIGSEIALSGRSVSRTVSVTEFRSALNSWGHCLEPDRYPGVDTDGVRLPQTVPSIWFGLSTSGGDLVLTGRGWGHGVGMVQWGAFGKAQRGLPYDDILAAYYGGLRPRSYRGPATIRIGMATGLATVRVVPTGPFTVQGRTLPPGPWLVRGGDRIHAAHAAPPEPAIAPGTLSMPTRARAGATRTAELRLPQRSVANLVLQVPGEDVTLTDPATLPAGTSRIRWEVPEVPRGTYLVAAVVTDGTDVVRTSPTRLRIAGGPAAVSPSATPTPTASPSPSPATATPTPAGAQDRTTRWPVLLGMALAAVAVAAVSILFLARRFAR